MSIDNHAGFAMGVKLLVSVAVTVIVVIKLTRVVSDVGPNDSTFLLPMITKGVDGLIRAVIFG